MGGVEGRGKVGDEGAVVGTLGADCRGRSVADVGQRGGRVHTIGVGVVGVGGREDRGDVGTVEEILGARGRVGERVGSGGGKIEGEDVGISPANN